MKKKLSIKMVVYISILVLVVAVGLGFAANYFASRTVRDEAKKSVTQITDLNAIQAQDFINEKLDVLYEVANREKVRTMNWNLQQEDLKDDVSRLGYLDLAIVTPDGKARYVKGNSTSQLGDRGYVKKAFEGQKNVSDVLISKVTNSAVLMFAVPIERGDEVVGVLIARNRGDALNDITDKMGIGKEGYVYVVNQKGTIVSHPNRDYVMKQTNIIEEAKTNDTFKEVGAMLETTLVEKQGLGSYKFKGRNMYGGYAPINGTDWILINVALEEEFFAGLVNMQRILLFASIGFIIMGIIIAAALGKSIANPIEYLSQELIKISKYDLTKESSKEGEKILKREDEIGKISKAIKQMRTNLKDLIHEITKDAENVAASSEELTATSEQVSIASDEVAETIQEIANGATDQAEETTEGAKDINVLGKLITSEIELVEILNESAKTVDELKEEGFVVLKDLEEKTIENNEAAKEVQEVIIKTNENADKIEKASDMIKNIAEQTNLLALNASIEAARAGEAGKGFAVVADEIRKLAEETNQFASEISDTITKLNEMTQKGVVTMEKASKIVKKQMTSLDNTHNKFEGISESIEDVDNVVDKLTDSTENMMSKKDQIINVIENLSAISEENAAGTQEASASVEEQTASMNQISEASEELAKLAQDMQNSISKFKI
ncbi:MAG: methyl-accepting chemotaxis protein [Bacillota bacterium]